MIVKICIFTKHYQGNQIKVNDMGKTSKMDGRNKKYTPRFELENLKGRDHLEVLHLGGRIKLDWILGKQFVRVRNGLECLSTVTLLWAFVSTVMNFQILLKA
jgi:hypothetical protein